MLSMVINLIVILSLCIKAIDASESADQTISDFLRVIPKLVKEKNSFDNEDTVADYGDYETRISTPIITDPKIDSQTQNEKIAAIMINEHNVLRENAGLRPLQHQPDLEPRLANFFTTKLCRDFEALHVDLSPDTILSEAENLWIGETPDGAPDGREIVNEWYKQKDCYVYGPFGHACTYKCVDRDRACANSTSSSMMSTVCHSKHFVQLMLDTNSVIGCVVHKCENDRRYVAGCLYSGKSGPAFPVTGALPFGDQVAKALGLNPIPCAPEGEDQRQQQQTKSVSKKSLAKTTRKPAKK